MKSGHGFSRRRLRSSLCYKRQNGIRLKRRWQHDRTDPKTRNFLLRSSMTTPARIISFFAAPWLTKGYFDEAVDRGPAR
jgi:hypothetical protein